MQSRLSLFSLVLLFVLLGGIFWVPRWLAAPTPPTPQPQSIPTGEGAQVEQAIRDAIKDIDSGNWTDWNILRNEP